MTELLTVGEYLQPVKNGSRKEQVLAAMAWVGACTKDCSVSSGKIRELLVSARIPRASKINVSNALARAQELVAKNNEAGGWWLTVTGQRYISGELGLSIGGATSPPVSSVRAVAAAVSDPVARGYVEEAILCLEAGALRASVVFLWTGAIRTLQERAMQEGKRAVTSAVQRHDKRAPQITSIDTFAWVKDKDTLLAARDLGLIDKGQWAALQEGLNLRNHCGHPTKYTLGVAKATAFIEDIAGIVFKS